MPPGGPTLPPIRCAPYTGPRQINSGSDATVLIASGIDLTSPVDFGELKWKALAQKSDGTRKVVAEVRRRGSLRAFQSLCQITNRRTSDQRSV
jgi:hypothetical protein